MVTVSVTNMAARISAQTGTPQRQVELLITCCLILLNGSQNLEALAMILDELSNSPSEVYEVSLADKPELRPLLQAMRGTV